MLNEKVRAALLAGLERVDLSPEPVRLHARTKAKEPVIFIGSARPTKEAMKLALDQQLVEETGESISVGKKGKLEPAFRLTDEGRRVLTEERGMGAALRGLLGTAREIHAEMVETRTRLEGAERNIAHLEQLVVAFQRQVGGELVETSESPVAPEAPVAPEPVAPAKPRTDPAATKELIAAALVRHGRYATFPGVRIDALFGSICIDAPDLDLQDFHQVLRELHADEQIKLERTRNPKEFAQGILIEENGQKLGIIHPV